MLFWIGLGVGCVIGGCVAVMVIVIIGLVAGSK